MNLARLDKNRITRFIGCRWTSFMFQDKRPLQDIDRKWTRMRVSNLTDPNRNLDDVYRGLVASDRRILL